MTLREQYHFLVKKLIDQHHDLIDSLIDRKFDPFEIEKSFAINSRSVTEDRLEKGISDTSIKEIFVFPAIKKHSPFCIALLRDKSSYKVLLNEETEKSDEFYTILIKLINSLISNEDIIKRHISYNQKVIKACTALSSILWRLTQNSTFEKKPRPIERPNPPCVKIKPQEGNCAVTTKARSTDR